MFSGIRQYGKSILSRIAALFADEPSFVATPQGNKKVRTRTPSAKAKARKAAGLPHGTSGAKLIRRAAEGRIGVR